MVRVSRVLEGSVAEELGIVPGTELLTVNGRELADFLDWEFLSADEELVIEATRQVRGSSTCQVADAEIALVAGGPVAAPVSSLVLRR